MFYDYYNTFQLDILLRHFQRKAHGCIRQIIIYPRLHFTYVIFLDLKQINLCD